jgi:hypothetical protein
MKRIAIIAMSLWVGGIFFFAIGEAPEIFAVLTNVEHGRGMAAQIIASSLFVLHVTGLVCGVIALIVLLTARVHDKISIPLLGVALALTAFSQFGVTPRIQNLHPEGTHFHELPADDMRRTQFNTLHKVSTGLEGAIFLCGIVVLWRMGGDPSYYLED